MKFSGFIRNRYGIDICFSGALYDSDYLGTFQFNQELEFLCLNLYDTKTHRFYQDKSDNARKILFDFIKKEKLTLLFNGIDVSKLSLEARK